jgi:hypothetical protein
MLMLFALQGEGENVGCKVDVSEITDATVEMK